MKTAFALSILFLFSAGQASAIWTEVSAFNRQPCDPLGLGSTAAQTLIPVDELGTAADFHDKDEGISAFANQADEIACTTNFISDPDLQGMQVMLSIKNETSRTFTDLWYVADPQTSLTNYDGIINEGLAFKIDGTMTMNLNNPLRSEVGGIVNERFEPGETWNFVIDNYKNSLGLSAAALESIGVGWESDDAGHTIALSSGSIIALVPEPTTALLMGLGLTGLSFAGRRKHADRALRMRIG
jgi:hypothetical protein